jgi:hypothetical protein
VTPCLTIAWARLAALDPWGRIAEARRARGCILPREPNPSALLDLARAGVLWTGAQHEDRHRPLDPRVVRWQERSNYRRLETTMDRDDDLTAQWDTDRAKAADVLARVIGQRDEARLALADMRADRDEARAAIGQMQDTARNAGIDAVREYLPGFDGSRIDGGCTDGSEYDFTAAEVKQCVRAVGEELDEARAALAAERAAVVAWLRRPVTEEEARAWLWARDLPGGPGPVYLDRHDLSADWYVSTRAGRSMRVRDATIVADRYAQADAIERGEHLTGGEGGR